MFVCFLHLAESSDDGVAEYKRIMLTFAKMEREIKQVQDAVEFVKQQVRFNPLPDDKFWTPPN